MTGVLPAELGNIAKLVGLELGGNFITGDAVLVCWMMMLRVASKHSCVDHCTANKTFASGYRAIIRVPLREHLHVIGC